MSMYIRTDQTSSTTTVTTFQNCQKELIIGSGIKPILVERNVEYLAGEEAVGGVLLTEHSKRKNAGRVSDYLLRRYRGVFDGGWWVSGVEPLTGAPMPWGQFKPNYPRFDSQKNKFIKYEAPDGEPTRVFCARIEPGDGIWESISERYDVPMIQGMHFWEWVLEFNLPVLVVEGAKKAMSLLSIGVIAIAIPGIWNGARRIDLKTKELISDLKPFATPGRVITTCFDAEKKLSTRYKVRAASRDLLCLFEKAGCTPRFVDLPLGENDSKVGVDDFIVKNGADPFLDLYDNAPTWRSLTKRIAGFFTPRRSTKQRELNPPVKDRGNVFTFKAGDRLKAIQGALQRKQTVIVGCHTGAGKSHFVGSINPEDLGSDQVFYSTPDHRNPSVVGIRDRYTDLPVRNAGLYEDKTEIINDQPRVRWARKDEQPNLPGNCPKTHLFHLLSEKGFAQEVSQTASDNPICLNCKMAWSCKADNYPSSKPTTLIEGVSFRKDRKKAMESSLIRCSIESLAPFGEDENDKRKRTLIIDEWNQIKPVRVQRITATDLDATVTELVRNGVVDAFEWMVSLKDAIHASSKTRYGFSQPEILQQMNLSKDQLSKAAGSIQNLIEKQSEKIARLTEADQVSTVDENGNRLGKVAKSINRELRRQQAVEFEEYTRNMAPNWLDSLLKALAGETGYTIRICNQKIELHTINQQIRDVLNSVDQLIILDATATPEEVALVMGIDINQVAVVKEEQPEVKNLQVIQITGLGHLGSQRSEDKQNRLDALIKTFKSWHNNLGIIDHKKVKPDHAGHWFHHNRGSNAYKECDAIALIGDPYENIGVLRCQLQLLRPNHTEQEFKDYVSSRVANEIVQGIGRLRAHRRQDELLTAYVVTQTNLDFLKGEIPGIEIIKKDAFTINSECGDRVQRMNQRILDAVKEIVSRKEKISAVRIAQMVGCHKSRISQIASNYRGWKNFKKSLVTLVGLLKTTINLSEISQKLDPEELSLAREFIPQLCDEDGTSCDVVEEFANLAGSDPELIERVLPAVPKEKIAYIFMRFMGELPLDLIPQEIVNLIFQT